MVFACVHMHNTTVDVKRHTSHSLTRKTETKISHIPGRHSRQHCAGGSVCVNLKCNHLAIFHKHCRAPLQQRKLSTSAPVCRSCGDAMQAVECAPKGGDTFLRRCYFPTDDVHKLKKGGQFDAFSSARFVMIYGSHEHYCNN